MSAVTEIKPHVAAITCPDEIASLPAWLMWRFEFHEGEDKPRKVPFYVNGSRRHGVQGRPDDRKQLTTLAAAKAAAARKGFDGVGFCPLPEFNVCALDFDHCVTAGVMHPELEPIIGATYAEFSPSGVGVRALVKGQYGNSKARGEPFGFETFSTRGFVTITGNRLPVVDALGNADTIAELDNEVRALCARRFAKAAPEIATPVGDPIGLTPAQIDACLEVLDPDLGHDDWLQVGMALHHETKGLGFELWNAWSERGGKYPTTDILENRWASFGKTNDRTVTARSLVRMANAHGARITLHAPASADEFEALTDDTPADPGKPLRFAVQPAHEFATGAAPLWLVKDVLPKAELAVMFGASGSGKTFMALDIAGAIARGVPWRGKRVRKGRVAYIAAEGAGGFRKRLAAYARQHEVDLHTLDLGIIHAAPNFLEKADAVDVVKALRAWGQTDVVIVDTFAQVTPGGNENGAEDVGKALAHCKRIHEATGALVLLVHHAGKDAAKGARGWSGMRAAADAELEVIRDASTGGRRLRLSKQKDGDDSLEWGFALEVVKLGVDEDLDDITVAWWSRQQ